MIYICFHNFFRRGWWKLLFFFTFFYTTWNLWAVWLCFILMFTYTFIYWLCDEIVIMHSAHVWVWRWCHQNIFYQNGKVQSKVSVLILRALFHHRWKKPEKTGKAAGAKTHQIYMCMLIITSQLQQVYTLVVKHCIALLFCSCDASPPVFSSLPNSSLVSGVFWLGSRIMKCV